MSPENKKIINAELQKDSAAVPSPALVLYADACIDSEYVSRTASHLHVTVVSDWQAAGQAGLVLRMDADGVSLVSDKMVLRGDFSQMLPRIRRNNLNSEILIRAARFKGADRRLTAVDATAGMGEDAFLLAAAGFYVRLQEYDPVIALLLRDALKRAAEIPELSDIAGRMELFEENSITALGQLEEAPDLILLDPMFPSRQKSARIKKKFQLLQQLEAPCSDEGALLEAAIAAKPHKIIIKRPLKGAFLADCRPDYSIKSNVIRYDCLLLQK